jgi:hypothetical protein
MQIQGYEKFWAALLTGGMVTAATTLALWITSLTGAVPVPDEATIAAAVTGIVASLFSAAGAYLATNTTPTHPEDNK